MYKWVYVVSSNLTGQLNTFSHLSIYTYTHLFIYTYTHFSVLHFRLFLPLQTPPTHA